MAIRPSVVGCSRMRTRASASRPSGCSAATVARTARSNTRSPRPGGLPAALAHLDVLLPMADDPDPGVRRELILAFRNLPTDKVGDALKKLTASWDGQDRWYLEALGLALEKRESASSPVSSTARCSARWIWSEPAATARSPCRRISRSIATRPSSPPARPTSRPRRSEQVPGPGLAATRRGEASLEEGGAPSAVRPSRSRRLTTSSARSSDPRGGARGGPDRRARRTRPQAGAAHDPGTEPGGRVERGARMTGRRDGRSATLLKIPSCASQGIALAAASRDARYEASWKASPRRQAARASESRGRSASRRSDPFGHGQPLPGSADRGTKGKPSSSRSPRRRCGPCPASTTPRTG